MHGRRKRKEKMRRKKRKREVGKTGEKQAIQ